jgi:ATP-binding cassette, subfamily C, bacterial CydD
VSSALVIAPARRLLGLATALDLGVVGATIAQIAAASQIVEQVLLDGGGLQRVRMVALALVAATLVRSVLVGARAMVGERAATHVKATARRDALAGLVRTGPSGIMHERAGELVALLGPGVERLDAWIARYLPQRVLSVSGPLLIAVYVAWLDPLSAAVLVGSAPIVPVLMLAVGSYAEQRTRAQWTALAQLSGYLLDVLQGLPTLKLFGREMDEAQRVALAGEAFRVRTMQALRQAFLSGFVLELLTTAAIALVAVELGVRLLNGAVAFGPTLQVLLLAPEFYRPLRELGAQRHAALEARPVAERVSTLLAAARIEVGSAPASQMVRVNRVELVDVSYRYPNAPGPALEHVHISLPPGSRTALVGPSGGGKSTLVKLLLRFVDPSSGAIYADGVPIHHLSPEAWRQAVALVPQHPHLFDTSALDNLRLARPAATLDDVVAAAELAGAHEFLRRLPDGYHTRLGERGARLSRGEAQRVAIARAFLKEAPLLILDEPTSALDPDSERVVRDGLARLGHGRTVVVVAHRLATVVHADQIVVLDGGVIVERGTHRELVARHGLYAQLVGARAQPDLVW